MSRFLSFCLATCLAGAGAAQQVEFDPADFGQIVLAPRQSAGAGGLVLEQAFGDYQNEPILTYGETSLPRQLGRPVGRLDMLYASGKTGVCTAFIVDENHILTNFHCVPGLDGGGVQAAQFVAGYVDGAHGRGAETFQVSVQPVESSQPLDYAVLRVFGDPASRFGTVEIAADAPANGEVLWIIGHPQGQAQHISREGCAADDPAVSPQGKLVHSCDTLGGNSGSPVFRVTDRKVIGLHHAGDNRTGYNFAIPMAAILAESRVLKAAAPVDPAPAGQCDMLWQAAEAHGCEGFRAFIETCADHPLAAIGQKQARTLCAAQEAEALSALQDAAVELSMQLLEAREAAELHLLDLQTYREVARLALDEASADGAREIWQGYLRFLEGPLAQREAAFAGLQDADLAQVALETEVWELTDPAAGPAILARMQDNVAAADKVAFETRGLARIAKDKLDRAEADTWAWPD
ncbi:trypsin-like serine peptidase [Pseudoponticoccus marisrubri]|uniref:Serine protease n=1 Tax=Pseudoponticoccus marisrubri TaxID=1685382 RepID=A0A0W7WMI4_9RHOB|nr:serine protease [Pseudoponticoccus marisrubri]KUF11720.1 hypothetical protein AVJ23_03805 [Pseudoponticoccus marisrubri]